MYLGSPRMAEVVIGEQVTLEEMGGARMHATVSGCGDNLVRRPTTTRSTRRGASSRTCRRSWREPAPVGRGAPRRSRRRSRSATIVPAEERRAYDMHKVIDALVDEDSFFELKPLCAQRADHRVRPARRHAGRHRRQQPDAPRRRAVRRLRRQGGPVHLAVRRVQRAAGVPRRRARLHDRLAGRAGGDHPPRREDDHRGRRGDGARSSR